MQRKPVIALAEDSKLIRFTLTKVRQNSGFLAHAFGCPTSFLKSTILHAVDCIVTESLGLPRHFVIYCYDVRTIKSILHCVASGGRATFFSRSPNDVRRRTVP
jgi:hypothetical protein